MDFNFVEILNYSFGGNSLREYLFAFGVFVLTLCFFKIFKDIGVVRIKKFAERTKTDIDDLVIKIIRFIGWPFYVILALWITFQFISIPERAERYFSYLALITLVFYALKAAQEFINFGTKKVIEKRQREGRKEELSALNLLNTILKAVLWLTGLLLILQNLGFQITTLIAGLGISGIAIAFALQAILGDIFACFAIYFDKPFEIGDFIIIGEHLGVVEKLGIKSTRIRSLWGEEIIISNKELTETRIRNFKKLEKRRIEFAFGVKYQTPNKKLEKIPEIVREITEKIELAQLERVHFQKFGDFSLIFNVVYYILTPDYKKYMDIQQEINLSLKERFEKEKIEFALSIPPMFK